MATRNIPESYSTIASAVAAAADGDIISINDSGIYALADVDITGKSLTVTVGDGAAPIVDWSASVNGGFVTGNLAETKSLEVDGITFLGADNDSGSTAVLFDVVRSPFTLTGCVFKAGQAITRPDALPDVIRCWFEGQHLNTGSNRFVLGDVDSCVFRSQLTSVPALISALNMRTTLLVDCVADSAVVVCATLCRANVAIGCRAKSYIFTATTTDSNVAHQCVAAVAIFSPSSVGNYVMDPELVDIRAGRLYPVNGSGIGWLLTGLTLPTEDVNGDDPSGDATHQTPGAFTYVDISAEVVDATTLLMHFKGDVDPDVGWWESAPWNLFDFYGAPGEPAAIVAARVAAVEPDTGDPVGVPGFDLRLTLWPEMSPNVTYRLDIASVPMLSGHERLGMAVEFSTTADLVIDTRETPPPYTSPEDFLRATATQVAALVGVPRTTLAFPYAPGDDVMWLTSTFGGPEAGMVFLDRIAYSYTSKSDGAIFGVSSPDTPIRTCQAGEEVVFSEHSAQRVS